MFDLTGKTAIITGGTRGLGEAMADGLAEFGANVAIFDVEEGTEVCEQIADRHGVEAAFYDVDVTDEARIEEAIGEVVSDFGPVHILINNAGIYYQTPVLETSLEDWDYLLRVDLTGYFLMAKHTIPQMPEDEGTRIINIASIAGHSAFEHSAAYCVAKGGVIELTKSLAYEFGPRGIRTNVICPGTFVTDMTSEQLEDQSFKETMKNQVPLGRAGRAEEIKGLAVYLASEASSYMNGSIIDLDGGWTCHV